MSAIQAQGLTNYYINVMAMDYGSTTAGNCAVVNGSCDMAQSAINAATSVHNFYGVPYSHIEITPDIGQNDTSDEVFTLANVDTLSSWAKANGLGGIHFWSLDRDTPTCSGGASTCNGYSQSGPFGFTNRFIADLANSGAHLTATQDVITLLAEQGAADVRVIVGGIIPDADIRLLRAMGVQAVFTPGADLTSIVETVGRVAAGTAEGMVPA